MNVPVITLEVEGMRHTLQVAIAENVLKMDAMVQRELDAACSPDNIERVVRETIQHELRAVLEHTIHSAVSELRYDGMLAEVVKTNLTSMIKKAKKKI